MPSRRIALVIIAVAALMLARHCRAWGATGYRIIGQIAWHYLTPEAKAGIADLLGDQSVGDAGCSGDEVRGQPEYDWARPLHFVNVAKDAEAVDTARDCPNGECVMAAIRKVPGDGGGPAGASRAAHRGPQVPDPLRRRCPQPLHVSYAGDRGGNRHLLQFIQRMEVPALAYSTATIWARCTAVSSAESGIASWDIVMIEQKLAGGDWMKWGDELQVMITAETAKLYASSIDPLAADHTTALQGGIRPRFRSCADRTRPERECTSSIACQS